MNFKPLRKRLEEITKKTGLRLDVVQQDYILSWLLVGIFQHPQLKSKLVFKGGTALKKGYFGEYRFSEDLDFSMRQKMSTDLFGAIKEACKNAEERMREYAPIRMSIEKYKEKQPHPHGQEAFVIHAQFPWQSQPLTKAMIEVSQDEMILLNPITKRLLHNYGEPIELEMEVYSLEEIILEKLRAILQHTKKLHESGWTRSRARDYYDIWRILNAFGDHLNLRLVSCLLPLKCFRKGVIFGGVEDFFNEKMISNVKRTWGSMAWPFSSKSSRLRTCIR